MQDRGNMNVTNPIYLRRDEDEDDDETPHGSSCSIFSGETVSSNSFFLLTLKPSFYKNYKIKR